MNCDGCKHIRELDDNSITTQCATCARIQSLFADNYEPEEPVKRDYRGKICAIVSDMLDNPNEHGIYPTTKCYDALEKLVLEARADAIKDAQDAKINVGLLEDAIPILNDALCVKTDTNQPKGEK